MYAGAAFLGLGELLVPGGPSSSPVPGLVALGVAALIAVFGARLPLAALAPLGPLGAALIAFAIASSTGIGDGAVLYVWPVVWTSYFFGRRGAVGIVAWIAVVHAAALASFSGAGTFVDRWLDVVVVSSIVAGVIEYLARRNRALVERLEADARSDALTGLLNRRALWERMPAELERARRDRTELAVVAFDLDHFKRINDEYGHDAGDRVLVQFARIVERHARATDLVARTGGEEFLAVLPGCSAHAAKGFAERIRAELQHDTRASRVPVTVSAGVVAPVDPSDIDAVLIAADATLYRAKSNGRNRVVVLATAPGGEPAAPDTATFR
jgi:diguanylate cyclase (GGDEF)-like protein